MKFNKISGVLRYLVLCNIYCETGLLYVGGGGYTFKGIPKGVFLRVGQLFRLIWP